MVELFAGRYAFVDLLGSGGMGTVWRVWDARQREYSAAKVLNRADSTSLLRFIRETSWRVDHDHVLTPTGWAAEDDQVLFTMPLLHGGTVGDLVRDFGALPDALVVDLLRQLLQALDAVHSSGLVHRDVKPSNLLLDPPGPGVPHLHLSDFGIATRIDEPRLTRIGEAVGTLGYTAPEVLTGADPDPAQDLYAAGVVALELLTGQRPARDLPAAPQRLGAHPLRPLVERLLAERAADRPTAVQALEVLSAVGVDRTPREGEPIEVFDQVPPLPEGWGPTGRQERTEPDRGAEPEHPAPEPAGPTRVAPTRAERTRIAPVGTGPTRTAPTETAAPAATTTAFAGGRSPDRPPMQQSASPAPSRDRRRRLVLPLLTVLLLVAGIAAIAGGIALLGS